MAVVYWRLGHLTTERVFTRAPLAEHSVVWRDGKVFDVGSHGWDSGIRPGDLLREIKWRYPQAILQAWTPQPYRKTQEAIHQWVADHAANFEQVDEHQGWWEWPRLTGDVWRNLMGQVIPRWAGRFEAGIASHPLLARWSAFAGKSLILPTWEATGGTAYVLMPRQEDKLWPQLPLSYVPAVTESMRRSWDQRGWTRVGDVPGLLQRVRQPMRTPSGKETTDALSLSRSFDDGLELGLAYVLQEMAEELAQQLVNRAIKGRRMVLRWSAQGRQEVREREWATAKGDRASVVARALALINPFPSAPPECITLQIDKWEPLHDQLQWWEEKNAIMRNKLPNLNKIVVPRREILLQHWDIWRTTKRSR